MSKSATAPEWGRWLDSMEGVPDWPAPAAAPPLAAWQLLGRRAFEWLGTLLPGLALALGLAFAAEQLARWLGAAVLGFAKSPVSAIPLAIALGLLIRNTVGLPAIY